jgi:dTMP kinase
MAPLLLRPGSLVVFEGLDRTGKSTQRHRLAGLQWAQPGPAFVHMPSGLTELTEGIYRLTEDQTIESPLARQLLHLACQAENMRALCEARTRGGVILDRWWWSTVAYGGYAGNLVASGITESMLLGLISAVWRNQVADVVCLFTTPYENDALNRDKVREGYLALADQHHEITVTVPAGDRDQTTGFLLAQLRSRGLLVE